MNETVTSFVEDVLRLVARADPQATDEKKLRILMRSVKDDIFGGLVRNAPSTVEDFVKKAKNIERALQTRASHYQRLPGVVALSTSSCNSQDLREIIQDVMREEIRKLLPAAASQASPSIDEIAREDVQRALQPEVLVSAAFEPPTLIYAATTRQPPRPAHPYTAPPLREPPAPQYSRRQ